MNGKSVSLHIDDQLVTVPEGTTILEAARTVNIDITTLCWAVLERVKREPLCTHRVIAFAITAAWFLNFSIVPMT